jgi:hypothetical protein
MGAFVSSVRFEQIRYQIFSEVRTHGILLTTNDEHLNSIFRIGTTWSVIEILIISKVLFRLPFYFIEWLQNFFSKPIINMK